MLSAGDTAPDFTLQDETSNPVSLGDLLDGLLLLYFYPADFTPTCTKQACMFRDIYTDMIQAGVRVIGISPQDPATHARFKRQYSIPFPLLSDPDKKAICAYGANGPLGIGVRRVSYLIGTDRKILQALTADFMVSKHEAFAADARARSGGHLGE